MKIKLLRGEEMFGGKKLEAGDLLVSLASLKDRKFNFSALKSFPLFIVKEVERLESVDSGEFYRLHLKRSDDSETDSIKVSYDDSGLLKGYKGHYAEYEALLEQANSELIKHEKSWQSKEREWIKKHEIQEIEKKTLNNIILGQTKIVADTSKSITKFLIEKGFENSDKVFKKFMTDTQDFFGSFFNSSK